MSEAANATNGDPGYVEQGDPRFDQFIEGEWRQAETLLASRGARVVWLTDPVRRRTRR